MGRLVPTLVYGDLRGAGHELLSRGDLDLRWALTLHEALAVSRRVKLDLVIASDQFALAYLASRAALPHRPPCIVLLGADYLAKQDELQAAGATVLVSASDPRRVVEAISELTGLTFRDHPRVPLHTVVDVQIKNDNHFLSTFDVSLSGVCIRDLPNARFGDKATITFDLFDPPLTVDAMVVRAFNVPEARCTGLCFTDLSDADRSRIAELVRQELAGLPMFTTTDIGALPGDRTIDLLTALGRQSDAGLSEYLSMIRSIVDGTRDDAPSWVFEVAAKLTDTERRAIVSASPAWARTAVELRIDLKRQVVDQGAAFDVTAAMDFCKLMAADVEGSTDDEAVDATSIRSALLRGVYQLHRHQKEREAVRASRGATSKKKGSPKRPA